jgi:hypothetical protein
MQRDDYLHRAIEEARATLDEAMRASHRADRSGDPDDHAMADAGLNAAERMYLRLRLFVCECCRGLWEDPSERWRLFVGDDQSTLLMLCPACGGARTEGQTTLS